MSSDVARAKGDALVLLLPTPLFGHLDRAGLPDGLTSSLRAALKVDRALAEGDVGPQVLAVPGAPGGRVVLAPCGRLEHEAEDVRRIADAALAATQRAVQAGAQRPVVVAWAPEEDERFIRAREVAALGALAVPGAEAVTAVGLDASARAHLLAVEAGRALARTLITGRPEEADPPAIAALCESAFRGTRVKVTTEQSVRGYPLLAAVARASATVKRHAPRVTRLELVPSGKVTRTLLIAGKGITYDTGGADVKTGGGMAGMSRDKGGAAAAAGLLRTLAELKLPGLRVVALLGWVRNSVGEESFLSDEVIRARSGRRVRIGNTDAEGRLLLADLLCALREEAEGERLPSPQLLSLATLTGHSYRAFGPCVASLENEASRQAGFLEALQDAGERVGEPFEFTRPRREDYLFCAPKFADEDLVSSNRLASVDTARGHQGPFAFIDLASGLHGSGLPFAHLDISGVALNPPDWANGRATGAPVAALAELLAYSTRGATSQRFSPSGGQ